MGSHLASRPCYQLLPGRTRFCWLSHCTVFLLQIVQVRPHYPDVPPQPTLLPRANVLIVDDDAGVRDVCTTMLKALGYDAKAESSGERALAKLADEQNVEVVLLDLEMPRMKGGEVLRALKQRRPGVRVVVMSGLPRADLHAYLATGADAVIQKPFRLAELDLSVGSALALALSA
jgi:CheY-like chemotaxis protein